MKRSYFVVGMVMVIFFVISLLTNIMGALIPDLKRDFVLSYALAGFLPFSFFVAYVASIPAAMLMERYHERPILVGSFVIALAGSLALITAPRYGVVLSSFFAIGIAMAMLQVVINPLLRVAGGEEHFAFFSVMAQLVFGGAWFVAPRMYTYLVEGLGHERPPVNWLLAALARVVPPSLPWISLYWIFSAVTLLMAALLAMVRLPRVELKEAEKVGALATHRELLRKPIVILFFLGVFAYVGTEQGVANWISEFLKVYHDCDPATQGAGAVSWFGGAMSLGCLLGLVLLKLFDSRRILIVFVVSAMAVLSLALFGPRSVALWAFPLVGFCLSVMWSIVFSLALNSLDRHHGSFSGILCTGIVGGAVVPYLIGWLSDFTGLRLGMTVLYLTLGYILSIGFWARPLVANATLLGGEPRGPA
jgi:FHS family L-fucose permease-like MFS transporter